LGDSKKEVKNQNSFSGEPPYKQKRKGRNSHIKTKDGTKTNIEENGEKPERLSEKTPFWQGDGNPKKKKGGRGSKKVR